VVKRKRQRHFSKEVKTMEEMNEKLGMGWLPQNEEKRR